MGKGVSPKIPDSGTGDEELNKGARGEQGQEVRETSLRR